MKTLTTLIAALAAVALVPAASAEITADVDNPAADCETDRHGTGPAFRDEVYTEDCDAHARIHNPYVACRTGPLESPPALEPRVWTDGDCDLHVEA